MLKNDSIEQSILPMVRHIVLNITLLQTWYPNAYVNVSLNGVAWYLSATVFLYFIFPVVLKWIRRKTKNQLILSTFLLLVFEIICCIFLIDFLGKNNPVYIWFMYCFPVFRAGDFIIGCVLGKVLFTSKKKSCSVWKMTAIELAVFLITILVLICEKIDFNSIILCAIFNWTTVYIPLALSWIVIFVRHEGVLTKMLCNKFLVFLGDISPYAFLIHYVITQYSKELMDLGNFTWLKEMRGIIVIGELFVSVIVSFLYTMIACNKKIGRKEE